MFEDVPTPADHGLPYEDVTLDTPDGIKIKCYLLVQRRHLAGNATEDKEHTGEVDAAEEDRKVCFAVLTRVTF
jgi:abhydrolase domain-containing protein 13